MKEKIIEMRIIFRRAILLCSFLHFFYLTIIYDRYHNNNLPVSTFDKILLPHLEKELFKIFKLFGKKFFNFAFISGIKDKDWTKLLS